MPRMLNLKRLVVVVAVVAASASCGDVARSGRAPVFLVIDSLKGSRGASSPGQLSGTLTSDVITNVTSPAPCTAAIPCPTIFGDSGEVILRSSLKDIGTAGTPAAPSSNNEVTITRYHVTYVRADGRNTPGVDVPYPFDGAVTGTIQPNSTLSLGFEIVRIDAKQEPPLAALVSSPQVLTTITNVTFYGRDLVGNTISATGTIQIDFANFGDF
jgi:hypothetical protein